MKFLYKKIALMLVLALFYSKISAQNNQQNNQIATAKTVAPTTKNTKTISGKIYDAQTQEAIVGAVITSIDKTIGTVSDENGSFSINILLTNDEILATFIGYEDQIVKLKGDTNINIALASAIENTQGVVVTANREAVLRTDAPVAISRISAQVISETKPVLLSEVINKVSGVFMSQTNNEGHTMSIRQPIGSTNAYFLYLEDGIPMRPMGLFNHNALIEMNMFAISSIEVIKGPASSLYGSEAVGGAINFITQRQTAVTTARVGFQADQFGYRRVQFGGGGMITKKLGFFVGGSFGTQRDSWMENSDYTKSSVNVRLDYAVSSKTKLTFAFSANEYSARSGAGGDSISFYNRSYTSPSKFAYRDVHAQRTRLSVEHKWNNNHETSASLFYRDNYIAQNPSYSVRWTSPRLTATGEINKSNLYSRGIMAQHSIKFNFLKSKLLVGGIYDNSPTDYFAYRIDLAAKLRPDKLSVEEYTVTKENPNIFLSLFDANLKSLGTYTQFEINPTEKFKITLGTRFDRLSFDYDNKLDNSTGNKTYQQITYKLGATYDFGKGIGAYGNYSTGFAPPSATAIFRPKPKAIATAPTEFYYNLEPAKFTNAEIGGWASFFQNKVYVDVSFYQMNGTNELLNIRQPDNSTDYQSAGKTLHRGIEYGITVKPSSEWYVRLSGTNAIHRYEEFILSTKATDLVKDVNGKTMPQSPEWLVNTEFTYKPKFIKGLRIGLEWQRISKWYQNQTNTTTYEDKGAFGAKGISILNARVGYEYKGFEVFTNIMNLTDELYAMSSTRGNGVNDRASFGATAPRTFVFGVQYSFAGDK